MEGVRERGMEEEGERGREAEGRCRRERERERYHTPPNTTNIDSTHPIMVPRVSKLSGTCAPAASKALFLASAVSLSPLAQAPAWPNWTSEVNILAQVPIHQATTGLKRRPVLMASQMEYSSIPPT